MYRYTLVMQHFGVVYHESSEGEYPTSRLHFLAIHTSLYVSVYNKKIQVTSEQVRHTRGAC